MLQLPLQSDSVSFVVQNTVMPSGGRLNWEEPTQGPLETGTYRRGMAFVGWHKKVVCTLLSMLKLAMLQDADVALLVSTSWDSRVTAPQHGGSMAGGTGGAPTLEIFL